MKAKLVTVARWASPTLNLYLLSDGRYWLDDVWNDRQGFLPDARVGDTLQQYLRPYQGFRSEPFRAVMADYSHSVAVLTQTLPLPYEVHVSPQQVAVLMPVEAEAGIVGEVAALCRRIDDVDYERTEHETYQQDKARLREIGESINEQGGYNAMMLMVQDASCYYKNAGNTLNVYWNNIGEWRS